MFFSPGDTTLLHSCGSDVGLKVYATMASGVALSELEVNVRLDDRANGLVFENPLTSVVVGTYGCSVADVNQVSNENISVVFLCDGLTGSAKHIGTIKYMYSSECPAPRYDEDIYGYCTAFDGSTQKICAVDASSIQVCNDYSCTGGCSNC